MRRIELGERPTNRGDLAGWYAAALAAQAASGLSVADYASQIGVAVPTLYQWRRRLQSAGDGHDTRTNLVEVTLARPTSTVTTNSLMVHINDGHRRIEVPRGFDGDDLQRLVALLESC